MYWRTYAQSIDFEICGFVSQYNNPPQIKYFKGPFKNPYRVYPLCDLEKAIQKHHVKKCLMHVQDIGMQAVQGIINRILANGNCEIEFLPQSTAPIKCFKPVIAVSALAGGLGKTQVCRYFTNILVNKIKRKVAVVFPITELGYTSLNTEFAVEDGLHYVYEPGNEVQKGIFSDADYWQIKLYLENGASVYVSTDIRRTMILAEQDADVIIYDSRSCETPPIISKYSFCIASANSLENVRKYSLWPGLVNLNIANNVIIVSKLKNQLSKELERYYALMVNTNLHNVYFAKSSYILEDSSGYDVFNKKVLTVDHEENEGSAKQLAYELGGLSSNSIVASFPRCASPTSSLYELDQSENEMDKIANEINQSDADIVIVSLEKDLKGINIEKQILYASPEIEDLDYNLFKYLQENFSLYQTAPLMAHFTAQVEILSAFANASDTELYVGNNNSRNREAFVRLFLKSHLPPGFRVTTGEIIDSLSNKTGELDVVVVNDSSPSLTIDTTESIIAPILADNVLTVIEVKTSLTTDQLKKALSQMRPVKALMTTHSTLLDAGGQVIRDPLGGKILTGIFSFNYTQDIEKKVPEIVEMFPGVVDFIVLPEAFGYFSVDVLKICGISVSKNDEKQGYKMFTSRGICLGILFGILNSFASIRRFSGAYCIRYLNGKWGDQIEQRNRVVSTIKNNLNSLNQIVSQRDLRKQDKNRYYQSYGKLVKGIEKVCEPLS